MDVKLPQLAEGVESGTVVSILVSEGQEIKKDQSFMELETQKAVGSIPAPSSGVVTKIHVKQGMEVTVGQTLISIDTGSAAATSASVAKSPQNSASTAPSPSTPSQQARSAGSTTSAATEDYRYESKSGAPPPAPPSIRKIARDLDIDLTRVKGSEAGGRITLADLRAYIQRLQQSAFQGAPAATIPHQGRPAPSEAVDFAKWGPVRREKLSPLRRTVSRRMVESWTTVPKINQFADADISALLALRKKHAAAYEKKGAHLTVTSFLLLLLGRMLKKHPRANSSLDEAASEIVFKDYCHIGVAVDTEGGLIVPILRDVDKKNLFQLSTELHALTEKTRQRKVSIEELQGGTFTISNQGSIGGDHFTPIIYAPQVAILGIGQGKAKPVALDGKIAIRTILPLCLAYDHRVLDGADAVRFLKDIIAGLEAFEETDLLLK
ncbi:MAG TPA: dihydrolipoamide acetyltransferase family protein [Candidatus Binatia bacterium]|jgi:pyruvate dehydrogenase E2 component (dihydrolipoamide acetyltransferase)|nr:dihydrolipoamide acetyltransferase family protein [Candidatus Binatia bacterium]